MAKYFEQLPEVKNQSDNAKMILAIERIKLADCERDVIEAKSLKDSANHMNIDDELLDVWNDHRRCAEVFTLKPNNQF